MGPHGWKTPDSAHASSRGCVPQSTVDTRKYLKLETSCVECLASSILRPLNLLERQPQHMTPDILGHQHQVNLGNALLQDTATALMTLVSTSL